MQIKVKDTKMHKIRSGRRLMYNLPPAKDADEIPVAEAKLVLLKVKHEGDGTTIGEIMDTPDKFCFTKSILISETEKIEANDWYWDKEGIHKATPALVRLWEDSPTWYKVLALPEHFSPKHLQAIVDGKMKDGDKVLVECYNLWEGRDETRTYLHDYVIKLNSSNHIILYRKEEKMYTREQVINALVELTGTPRPNAEIWFDENVK